MTGKPRGYGCRKCSRGECQHLWSARASCEDERQLFPECSSGPAEDDCGGLSIPPAQIPKQLIDRLRERARTAPKLTFGNEDVASVDPDKDVSLAGEIKSKC